MAVELQPLPGVLDGAAQGLPPAPALLAARREDRLQGLIVGRQSGGPQARRKLGHLSWGHKNG